MSHLKQASAGKSPKKEDKQEMLRKRHEMLMTHFENLRKAQREKEREKEKEKATKQQSIIDFLFSLDDSMETIPDEVILHNLEKAGCDCPEKRVFRPSLFPQKRKYHGKAHAKKNNKNKTGVN